MTEKEQIEFILEQCKKMREKNAPSLMELWSKQQEEYRRQLGYPLYSYNTTPYKNGYNLYTY